MIALISFLLVILLSIIIIRIATVALEMTGLSREVASFQAQSAFSGVGFTTSESEYVVSHPVRRKIIRILMLLGSAGFTSAITTLILTFVGTSFEEAKERIILLAIGIFLLYLFARSKFIDNIMRKIIRKALERFTSLKVYDYMQLLGLSKGYTIAEITVNKDSWLANKKLKELELEKEGILILGIYRNIKGEEMFIGVPSRNIVILPGDKIICYGLEEAILNLSRRLKGKVGDIMHEEAIKREKVRRKREEYELKRFTEKTFHE